MAHGPKVVYYDDIQNDEFSTAKIKARRIDGSYRYIRRGFFARAAHFLLYRVLAMPLAWLYLKIRFGHRIRGRRALRALRRGQGCYLFGNHTQPTADALIPTMVAFPRDVHVIVHPANVSMPVLGRLTPYLGALPLPDDLAAGRAFLAALAEHTERGRAICVYPEAHIWPWCTFIRPFSDKSFAYPVRAGVPVFCFTNTYRPRLFGRGTRLVTFVDGPFYPDKTLSPGAARTALRDAVYAAMCRRAEGENRKTVVDYRPR